MDWVEAEGDTIDAAIDNALKQLGVTRVQVTVDILSEGRKGLLGFGAHKARVRAALRKPASGAMESAPLTSARSGHPVDPPTDNATETADRTAGIDKARAALENILRLMGVRAAVEQKTAADGAEIVFEVKAQDSGLLIGRKGQTLEALQYLIGRIAGDRQGSDGCHIVVDVENYRERRRKSLEHLALRLGEKAKRQRKTVTIDALSAADRRIIHAVLQDDPWVTTRSLGQGVYRRLLIVPEGDRKKKDDAKSTEPEPTTARPQRSGA